VPNNGEKWGGRLQGAAVSAGDFVWLLGSLCQLNRLPFDPQLLLQRFPAPHTVRNLLEAAQSFGFKTGEGGIAKPAFPCVGFLKAETPKPAILVKADGDRLLYFVAGSQSPETAPADKLAEHFEPALIFLRHENAAAESTDGGEGPQKFGFRWFANELLRHKRIWRDVLAASLFIQLIGLTTPLFTQVIIDKVVVHQTGSTLIAIAVGLVMFMLFSAGMSWTRCWAARYSASCCGCTCRTSSTAPRER
jgi:subfamily B ATP-binding cassette protein HlyB/CyaB